MPIPVINKITIPNNKQANLAAIKNAIRNAFTSVGFSANNFDSYTRSQEINYAMTHYYTCWVVEYLPDPEKPNHKIYVRICVTDQNNNLSLPLQIIVDTFRTWTPSTDSGTGGSQVLNLNNPVPGVGGFNFDTNNINNLTLTGISHPELKGFILEQNNTFNYFFLVTPANKQEVFGFDNINHPWAFITNDFLNLYQGADSGANPFNDPGAYAVETSTGLKNRFKKADGSEIFQLLPAPKIISPNNRGFLGWFSNDICLVNSNMLPVGSELNVGLKKYMLITARNSSGVAIAIN